MSNTLILLDSSVMEIAPSTKNPFAEFFRSADRPTKEQCACDINCQHLVHGGRSPFCNFLLCKFTAENLDSFALTFVCNEPMATPSCRLHQPLKNCSACIHSHIAASWWQKLHLKRMFFFQLQNWQPLCFMPSLAMQSVSILRLTTHREFDSCYVWVGADQGYCAVYDAAGFKAGAGNPFQKNR
jgi:hypothetical protein